jgi:hypothetical protein
MLQHCGVTTRVATTLQCRDAPMLQQCGVIERVLQLAAMAKCASFFFYSTLVASKVFIVPLVSKKER